MVQAAIGLGISTGLSLLGNSLRPVSRTYNEVNKSDSLILPKSGSGFTLSRIYGKKKIESCFIFWAVDKINRPTTSTQTSGGKKGGNRSSVTTTTNNYFYTFAVAVCDGSDNGVSEIKQIYFNGKIWYNAEGELEGTAQNNSFILSQHLEIYLGTSGQGKSPTIESYEGSRRTPPLKHTCYLVFREIPESVVEIWPPTISVTVQGSKDNLYTTINDVCESAGLIESVHFHAGTVGNITITGAEFKQDGGTYADFLDELLQRHFVMARIANNGNYGDYNGAIQFLRQNDEGLTTHTLTADDLRAREVGSGEDIEPYKEIFEDALKLPSEVSVTAVDPNNKFKAISRSVIKHGLTHRNVLNINTNLAMTEGMCDELAYKKLKQAWIERREYEEITLLPHWLDAGMIAGDKLVLPLESGDNVTLQITEINIGANFLLNIKAKAFEEDLFTQVPTREFSDNVTASSTIQLPQTNLVSFTSLTNASGTVTYVKNTDYSINLETGVITLTGSAITEDDELVANYQSGVDTTTVITNDPTLETPNYPDPELVLLDIYKPKSTDREGLYIAIKSSGDFTDTGIFARESGGSYQQISVISNLSTVGTISSTLPLVTGEDLTSTLTIVLDNGTIDPLSDTDYGNNVEVLLIGDEQVCIKNKTLTALNTYSCTTIKRGLNGTVAASHAIGTRVIMLKGNNDLPLIELPSTQIGKTLEFKAVVVGKTINQVATQYSINFTGNAWECLPVSSVTATKDQGGNIYIDWTGNNRGTGLVLPEKYEIDIIDSGVIRTLSASVSNCVYSYTDQVTDFGSVQSTIEIIIYQISSEVGRGIPYAISLTPSLVSIVPTITGFSPTQGGIGASISIFGTGFTGASNASINGIDTDSLVIVSDGLVTGTIATGTTTGKITVTNASGTGESLTDFVIVDGGVGGGVAWGEITGTLEDQSDLQTELDDLQTEINTKQATLVSGTNIKTINGESLLGAGNIVIIEGGSSFDVGTFYDLYPRNSTKVLFASPFNYRLTELTGLKLASGTCTITIQIGGVNVTGLSDINVTTTPQDLDIATLNAVTSLNVVRIGQSVSLIISNYSGASELEFTLSASMFLFNIDKTTLDADYPVTYCPREINDLIYYPPPDYVVNYCPREINDLIYYPPPDYVVNYCPREINDLITP